jgi:hypothetical protein
MKDKIIAVTKEHALLLARLALIQGKVLIIEDSLNATYRERKLGLGSQNRDGVYRQNLIYRDIGIQI